MNNTGRFCALLIVSLAASVSAQEVMKTGGTTLRGLPMYFTESAGPNGKIVFTAHGGDFALFVTGNESVMVMRRQEQEPVAVRLTLSGANEHFEARGENRLDAKSNFLIGNDPSKWRTGVSQYATVRIPEVYRGIDAVFYGNDTQFEYDFIVRPGADPNQIRFRFDGVEHIEIDPEGNLVLDLPDGQLRQRLPFVYQEIGGRRHRVRAAYRRYTSNEFGFDLAAYDSTIPLVIDPVLVYSTYLGGGGDDTATGIAVDGVGNAYVTGYTLNSVNFPTTPGAFQTSKTANQIVAFVTKFNPSGTPVYSTYLGGTFHTEGHAIAVDGSGSAYVTGNTIDSDFPVLNAPQPTPGGLTDIFITKLNATGTALVYSTFLGGQTGEGGYGIAVDGFGNAIVTGDTSSSNFPTVNALQPALSGIGDAFVAKLSASGSTFVYVTLLGGHLSERGTSAAADAGGNAYIAGFTSSSSFPTANAFQSTFGGVEDGFVTKLNPLGSALVYSTFLGGSTFDGANGITVDSSGAAIAAGFTLSSNFPTANALQPVFGGASDVFVTKLASSGSALVYSTFFGGSDQDGARAITMDDAGNVYFAGQTLSSDFPTLHPVQPSLGGNTDAIVTAFDSAGATLIYSTYLGGTGLEQALGIGVSDSGVAVITGVTGSSDFPTTNAFQPTAPGGPSDAFVAAIATPDLAIAKTANGDFVQGQTGATFTITVSNNGAGSTSGVVTVTDTLPAGLTATSMTGSGWTCDLDPVLMCTQDDALAPASSYPPITLTVDVGHGVVGSVMNTATVSGGGGDLNPANNSDTATVVVEVSSDLSIVKTATTTPFIVGQPGTFTITVTNNGPSHAGGVTVTDTIPPGTFVSVGASQGSCSGTTLITCTLGTLNSGASATITLVVRPTAEGPFPNTAIVSATTDDPTPANNTSTAAPQVQSAVTAIPTTTTTMLMLFAMLLGGIAAWMAGRVR